MKHKILTTLLMGAVLGFLPPAFSQQATDAGPALGVARISLVNGDVSTRRGDSGDWVIAGINAPVVEGDMVATAPDARTEIQLDYSNLIRLDGGTEAQLGELGERNFRVQVFNGRLTYSELNGGEADIDIETPHAAIRPQKNGRYEIDTRPGETVLQVRKGEAEVFTSNGSEIVRKGQMIIVRDAEDVGIQVRLASAEPRGDWDRWNKDRDERLSDVDSYRYVSRSISGAADLDGRGDWRYVSGYGYTWYPRVSLGWAPYRHGHWAWTNYYGWTWVGSEPWGWAPYHYGRWSHHPSYGWGWYPGQRSYRHSWRPALVSFFGYNSRSGFSAGIGLGFGYGNIGWVPLAPGERYHPWYGRGGYGYGNRGGNVKIKNSTIVVDNSVNIYNDYRNARVRNGTTVVNSEGFSRGRLDNARSLDRNELSRATVMRGDVPVVPTRQAQGALRSIRNNTASNNGTPAVRRTTFSRAGTQATARPQTNTFAQQRERVATSVRTMRTQGPATATRRAATVTNTQSRSNTSAARVSGTVRSAPTTTRSNRTAATTSRSGVTTRSVDRSSPTFTAPGRSPAATSGTRSATRTTTTRSTTTRTTGRSATQPLSSRTTTGTRSGSRPTTTAPSRSGAMRAQPPLQQRNNSIDRGPALNRSSSRATTAPSRSQSRVDRSSTGSVTTAPRTRSTAPTRSNSRVSSRSSSQQQSRVSRAPAPQTRSSAPQARAPRQSQQRAPQPSTRSQAPRQSQPRMSRPSAPSRSSAPRMSAPRSSSRGASAPRSSGASRGGSAGGRRR